MPQPVAVPGEVTAIELVLHLRNRVKQARDLRLSHGLRGVRGKTALDQLTPRIVSSGPFSALGVRGTRAASNGSAKMPEPMRTPTTPSISSTISGSRTEGRETPSCSARSRSGGSCAPAAYSPRSSSPRSWSAIWG